MTKWEKMLHSHFNVEEKNDISPDWEQMNQLLDEYLPVKKKRRFFFLWFIFGAFISLSVPFAFYSNGLLFNNHKDGSITTQNSFEKRPNNASEANIIHRESQAVYNATDNRKSPREDEIALDQEKTYSQNAIGKIPERTSVAEPEDHKTNESTTDEKVIHGNSSTTGLDGDEQLPHSSTSKETESPDNLPILEAENITLHLAESNVFTENKHRSNLDPASDYIHSTRTEADWIAVGFEENNYNNQVGADSMLGASISKAGIGILPTDSSGSGQNILQAALVDSLSSVNDSVAELNIGITISDSSTSFDSILPPVSVDSLRSAVDSILSQNEEDNSAISLQKVQSRWAASLNSGYYHADRVFQPLSSDDNFRLGHEKVSAAYTVGFGLSYQIRPKWSFHTGLDWYRLHETTDYPDFTEYIPFETTKFNLVDHWKISRIDSFIVKLGNYQKIFVDTSFKKLTDTVYYQAKDSQALVHSFSKESIKQYYHELPLQFGYHFSLSPRLKIGLRMGVKLTWLRRIEGKYYSISKGTPSSIDYASFKPQSIHSYAMLCLGYKLGSHWTINLLLSDLRAISNSTDSSSGFLHYNRQRRWLRYRLYIPQKEIIPFC